MYKILEPESFREGEIRNIKSDSDKRTFALTKIRGEFYAFKHTCPHHGAELKNGIIKDKNIVCPWHHARFDLENGKMTEPPGPKKLQIFPVTKKDGEFYVDLKNGAMAEPSYFMKSFSDSPAYVIIGGGAAGASAAESMREEGFGGKITLIDQEESESYDRTLLSKEFLAEGHRFNRIPVRDADFYRKAGIERVNATVENLDIGSSKLTYSNGEEISFDKLLIASGGIPIRPPFPGANSDNVYTLRSFADAQKIKAAAETYPKAVVIGASFIGMECASSLRKLNVEVAVTAIEDIPFETILGKELGKVIQKAHEKEGVKFHLGNKAMHISQTKDTVKVKLEDGTVLEGGFVVLGTGIRPATDFIDKSLLEKDGSVKVDANMRMLNSSGNIFAAGDIACFPYSIQGKHIRVEHWRVAEQLGICAAKNMCGQKYEFNELPLFWTDQFDINLCYVGYAKEWDETIIHGKLEEDFIIFYVKGNEVLAAAGKWRDAEMCAIEERMKTKTMPSVEEIRNGFSKWLDF